MTISILIKIEPSISCKHQLYIYTYLYMLMSGLFYDRNFGRLERRRLRKA